ncbi:MAG: hypothetical protein J7485_13375, partial [Sphingobium sp.]|nr:hypothetical protein [Sphingobium sp.]
VLQSDVFTAADATNLNHLAIEQYALVMKSAAYGTDDWVYYMGKLANSGMHNLFVQGGSVEGSDVYSMEQGWGWWGIGGPDDLTAHPYADMVGALP